jgi:hypothetical protein
MVTRMRKRRSGYSDGRRIYQSPSRTIHLSDKEIETQYETREGQVGGVLEKLVMLFVVMKDQITSQRGHCRNMLMERSTRSNGRENAICTEN